MKPAEYLKQTLQRIDGRGYKAYKDIEGSYDFGEFALFVDHVQADPFAPPSRVRVRLDQNKAGFPGDSYHSKSREIALRDFLTRRFSDAARKFARGKQGTGKSGIITIDRPGQEILERTSMFVTEEYVEARFFMGLPAFGRRIAGRSAEFMFFDTVLAIIESSLYFRSFDGKALYRHIEVAEDADFLRNKLESLGLVTFVADGSILPRESGIDPHPLSSGTVVPFESPESRRVKVTLPNQGTITGMGIPKGVTLIVGGGYHGKSTLLKALELGVYNHIPGDGREFVVSEPSTVKIRAEDGRRIEKVNISPFISGLPFGKTTTAFTTEDASGSTSQAANIMEALELGTGLLLIDEDSSATNFMIRDHRMQELVSKDQEPITPFIDKVRQLHHDIGVSTILVIGGSGDYFDVADNVICMVEYRPRDYTEEAFAIAKLYKAERKTEGGEHFGIITNRIPLATSFDPSRGKKQVKISAKGLQTIAFGMATIELGSVEQLVDRSQTKAIADAIYHATHYMDGKMTLREVVDAVMADIREKGMDVLNSWKIGDYALFRKQELAAAMNRLRTLEVAQREQTTLFT